VYTLPEHRVTVCDTSDLGGIERKDIKTYCILTVFPRPNAKVWKLQPQAIHISIYPVTTGMPYIFALPKFHLDLHSGRENVNKRFFRSISHHSCCILSLLPPKRDSTITSRLRSAALSSASYQNKTFYVFGSVYIYILCISIESYFYVLTKYPP